VVLAETVSEVAQDGIRVYVCVGPPKCPGKDETCLWCYVVQPGDERTTEQIVADMKARNRNQ
jgi:hypothetical protein